MGRSHLAIDSHSLPALRLPYQAAIFCHLAISMAWGPVDPTVVIARFVVLVGKLPKSSETSEVWLRLGRATRIPQSSTASSPRDRTPEARALAYLAREVPRWSAENKCFSCHNNGDAVRALYTAMNLSYPVPAGAIEDTSAWLSMPQRWEHNGGEGPFSDKRLARIQFAAALRTAVESGVMRDRKSLVLAAQMLAEDQEADGSWPSEEAGNVGSPTTYGIPLATYMARETLRAADPKRFSSHIEKADHWLLQVEVRNIPSAAVARLAFQGDHRPAAVALRQRALALLTRAQSSEGGWGPYVTAPPEPFDTAIVLLALCRDVEEPIIKAMVQRGRIFLLANQIPDGSWPETTRPPGVESYAQRLSTTGWATLAILATREKSPKE